MNDKCAAGNNEQIQYGIQSDAKNADSIHTVCLVLQK